MILPQYGLSGGFMVFDPSSLVLFVNESLDEIQAILKGGLETTTSSLDGIQLRSRLVHERDHLFRHLSTSYGFFRHGLHSMMVRHFFKMADMANPAVPLTLQGFLSSPLRRILKSSPPSATIRELSQDDRVRPSLMYLANLECLLALDGNPAFLDRDLLSHGIATWEAGAQELSGRKRDIGELLDLNKMPPERLSRYVNPEDPFVPIVKSQPLGASHILEFFGVLIEFAYLSNQGVELIESSDLLKSEAYFRLSSVFFGDFFQVEMKEGKFPAFPVELEAAADLALAIPLTPQGLRTTTRTLSWFDIQPGWRFLQICDYFESRKQPWTQISPQDDSFDNYDSAFRRIQDEVCTALGWPQVQQVESEWQGLLDELDKKAVCHPQSVDLRGSGRQRIGRHLFSERVRTPYSMYLKRRNGAVDRELFFPAAISDEGMTAFEGLHWTNAESDRVNWDEYLLLTGCRFFAEGAIQHAHMQHDHAVGAAELLSRCAPLFGCNPAKLKQFLTDYLNLNTYQDVKRAWEIERKKETEGRIKKP